MGQFADYASQALGVRLPEDYVGFMETYGKRLSEDPVHKESWIGGLGSPDFVMGTTLAFRSTIARFPPGECGDWLCGHQDHHRQQDAMKKSTNTSCWTPATGASSRLIPVAFQTGSQPASRSGLRPDLLRALLKEKYTSNLTVIVFDDELKAEEARLKLLKLQREGFIELEDAVVVVKELDGTVTVPPDAQNGTEGRTRREHHGAHRRQHPPQSPDRRCLWRGHGGRVRLSHRCGNRRSVHERAVQKFKPGCSALFTLVRKADPERVAEAFLGFGGKVLVNSVSKEREAAIQQFLDAAGENRE